MRKGLLSLVIVLLLGGMVVVGQVPVPYTFVPGQVASSSQVNANFKALADNALNRAGGTVTGNIAVNPGVTVDGVDISAMLANSIITADRGMFIGTVLPQLSVGYDVPHSMLIGIGSNGSALFDLTAAGAVFTFDDPVSFPGGLTCAGCIDASDLAPNTITGGQLDQVIEPGSWGSASRIPTFTVGADGRLRVAGDVAIAFNSDLFANLTENEIVQGDYTFTGGLNGLRVESIEPRIDLWDTNPTSGPTDMHWWSISAGTGSAFQIQAFSDGGTPLSGGFSMNRSTTAVTNAGLASSGGTIDIGAPNGLVLLANVGTARLGGPEIRLESLLTTFPMPSAVLRGQVGTVSAPFYSFTADPDTGMFAVANTSLSLAVNATEMLKATPTRLTLRGDIWPVGNGTQNIGDPTAKFGGINLALQPCNSNCVSVVTTADGWLYYQPSTRALKQDIQVMDVAYARGVLNRLEAVRYRPLKADRSVPLQGGFIADDVEKAGLKELVGYYNGKAASVDYARVVVYLTAVVKDQQKQIDALKKARP